MPFKDDTIAVDKTAIDTLVDYGKALTSLVARPVVDEKIHYAVVPTGDGGFKIQSLVDYQYPQGVPPERIKASPKLQDGVSFCKYVQQFQDELLCVFADTRASRFAAVMDYHSPEAEPQFCQHTAEWAMEHSPQWKIWYGKHETVMNQETFVDFLEDNYRDIVSPSHQDVLHAARELKVHNDVTFEQKYTPEHGAVTLNWNEEMKQTGKVRLPEMITIKIPVYYGEPLVEIPCRLRFRIKDGKLTLHYKMYRPEEVKIEAFQGAVVRVAETLGVNVHLGTAA